MKTLDFTKTASNLQIFNDHIKNNEDYVLRVSSYQGKTYVEATSRSNMTFWDKFCAAPGLSKYNLKNVLATLSLSHYPSNASPEEIKTLKEAMNETGELLRTRVLTHYQNKPKQQESVISQVDQVFDAYLKPLPPAQPTTVETERFPLIVLLQTNFGFDFYRMAVHTFEVKDAPDGTKRIQPDERILQQCSNQNFKIQNHPTIKYDMMQSLESAWRYNPELLLEYAKNNPEAIKAMFKDNPIKISVDIREEKDPLSAAQIELLKVLPVKELRIERDEYSHIKMRPRLSQLFEVIPEMKSLTYVNALSNRHLPPKFYPAMKNITKFAARMPDEDIRHIKEFPKLENLIIEFENSSSYAQPEDLQALQSSQHLRELTLDGVSCRNINVIPYLLKLPPTCTRLRLRLISVDLENRALLEHFREHPLDTLYLVNYSDKAIEKFRQAGIAKTIINETGPNHPLVNPN